MKEKEIATKTEKKQEHQDRNNKKNDNYQNKVSLTEFSQEKHTKKVQKRTLREETKHKQEMKQRIIVTIRRSGTKGGKRLNTNAKNEKNTHLEQKYRNTI